MSRTADAFKVRRRSRERRSGDADGSDPAVNKAAGGKSAGRFHVMSLPLLVTSPRPAVDISATSPGSLLLDGDAISATTPCSSL